MSSPEPAHTNTAALSHPQAAAATRQALDALAARRIPQRIRRRDHTVWRPDPREIADRLGWLDAGDFLRPHLPELAAFAAEIRNQGYQDAVLLGMGGSSLGPEVLQRSFTPAARRDSQAKGNLRLTLLDSTVPEQVAAVAAAIDPAHTLFIVSSKSGGTIETLSFYRYFRALVESALARPDTARPDTPESPPGANFVAITDAGTPLERLAQEASFRRVFLNPADIGGRYSVLSWFGMLPAALAGMDIARLLDSAATMRNQCLNPGPNTATAANPGLWLGALLGAMTLAGRDKVTLIAPPPIDSFGLWVEQMIAESLGKEGRGIIPVAGEPTLSPGAYGDDRLFIYLRPNYGDASAVNACDQAVAQLETAGHPVARLTLTDPHALGAEFFRWEYATAIAGSILDVHPFDQPDVQSAKDNTDRLLTTLLHPTPPSNPPSSTPLPEPPSSTPLSEPLPSTRPTESPSSTSQPESPSSTPPPEPEPPPSSSLAALLEQARPGDYLAVMPYIQPTPETNALLDELRARVMQRCRIAVTVGYGPRYLHSTGQLHKGGPNNGLYLQLTATHQDQLPIPGQPYGFATLAAAQAAGDHQALANLNRRLITVNLGPNPPTALRRLLADL